MVKCALCPSMIVEGKLCLSCGKAYCIEEMLETCPFKCDSNLSQFKINAEVVNDFTVEWLSVKELKVGLIDFREIPSSLPSILKAISSKSFEKYIILAFPNRSSVNKFVNYLRQKLGLKEIAFDGSFNKSKYTLMYDYQTKKDYILLNLDAIDSNQIKYLLEFLGLSFSSIEKNRNKKKMTASRALSTSIFNYEKRLGLPFVLVDEELKQSIIDFANTLSGIYGEYEAIVQMAKAYPQETPDFLWQKLRQMYYKINPSMLMYLYGSFDFVNSEIQICSLIAASRDEPFLRKIVDERLKTITPEFQDKMSEFPDLLRCSNIIHTRLSKSGSYTTFETYQRTVASTILAACREIIPKTLRAEEIDKLFEISSKYETLIEQGEPAVAPMLGTFDEFNAFLFRLFYNKTLFPEYRIIIGQILQGNLCFKVWRQNDYLSYIQGLKVTRITAELITSELPGIKRRFGKENTQKSLGYHDACLALLMFSQFSEMLNDETSAQRLIEESEIIADRYNVPTAKILHNWKHFILSHDYNKLLEILNLFSVTDISEHSYIGSQARTIMLIGKAIFRKDGFEVDMVQAVQESINISVPFAPKEVALSFIEKNVQNSLVFTHLAFVFRYMLIACHTDEPKAVRVALWQAFLHAESLKANLSIKDPLNYFVLKTELIWSLHQNSIQFFINYDKLVSAKDSKQILHFTKRVKAWSEQSFRYKSRRFLISDDTSISERDPWELMLTKIISESKNDDFKKSIAYAHAFVFVEGPIDVEVLQWFATKLLPRKRIFFMPVEGFTTMSNYYQTNIVKEIDIPIFMLYDGDVLTDPKKRKDYERLIKKIDLPKNQILTLPQNSIENYLLVPYSIKEAFPESELSEDEILKFIRLNTNKRDKKQVLNNLLCQMKAESYGPEIAEKIAKLIKAEDINLEIKEIFSKITFKDN